MYIFIYLFLSSTNWSFWPVPIFTRLSLTVSSFPLFTWTLCNIPQEGRGEERRGRQWMKVCLSGWVPWSLSRACQVSMRKGGAFKGGCLAAPLLLTQDSETDRRESAEGQIIAFRWLNVFHETKSREWLWRRFSPLVSRSRSNPRPQPAFVNRR